MATHGANSNHPGGAIERRDDLLRAQPAEVVADPDAAHWDDEADVVIVGFGGAGVAAAIEAREAGANVLAIDRFGGGGSTAFSGGTFYAGGTRHQRAAGFDDTPEEMFKYLEAEGNALSAEGLRNFCEQSRENLAWLERHGVPYGSTAYLGKTAYPPDGYWLFFSGNERLPEYAAKARPAPRGHRTATPGFGGKLYFETLKQAAAAAGVRVLAHAPVQRLLVDPDNRVIGVECNCLPQAAWKQHDALYRKVSPWRPFNGARAEQAIRQADALEQRFSARRRIRARGGVILATGGFTYNLEMLRRHREVVARNHAALLRLGSMGCDGSGIELARSVGARTALMDRIYLGRPLSPPEAFVYGLMVNSEGERFVSEDAYQSVFGDRLAEQSGGGRAWLILDAGHFWRGVRQSLFPGRGMFMMWGAPALMNIALGGTRRARTLRGLARKCGLDAERLESTVAAFNARAEAGEPDLLGKSPDKMVALREGGFYAVNVSLDNVFGPAFSSTLGGLVLCEATGRVLAADGAPIEGLYGAGRCAVGVPSLASASGLSIADTVFTGRRAARHALAAVPAQAAARTP